MITLESQTKSLTCGKVKIKFAQPLHTGRLYYEYERKIFFSDSKYLFVSERNDENRCSFMRLFPKFQPRLNQGLVFLILIPFLRKEFLFFWKLEDFLFLRFCVFPWL